MKQHTGGCACGEIRFALADHPAFVLACHCNECKKRTGSDYGVSVVSESANVALFEGETKTYLRTGDSGREIAYEFCPKCGTTVRWKVAHLPNREVFAVGAFDDAADLKIAGEMYTDFKLPWVDLGCDLSRAQAPDDAFRSALADRYKTHRR